MSNLYFLHDKGFAIYFDGAPYRRINPDGVALKVRPNFETIGENDIANISAFTWNKDDDNTNSTNHKTWSACEMAATYLSGTGGSMTTKSGVTYSVPENVFVIENTIPLGAIEFGRSCPYGGSPATYFRCAIADNGGWTAPGNGVVRLAVTDSDLSNTVPSQYQGFSSSMSTSEMSANDVIVRQNYRYPIEFFKRKSWSSYQYLRTFPRILSNVGAAIKHGNKIGYVGQPPVHTADAAVRADWLAVRVKSGDKILVGNMDIACGLGCEIYVDPYGSAASLDCTGKILQPITETITEYTQYTLSLHRSAKMQTAMIFLPDAY